MSMHSRKCSAKAISLKVGLLCLDSRTYPAIASGELQIWTVFESSSTLTTNQQTLDDHKTALMQIARSHLLVSP